jgi:Tol biopolymer transport system component
MTSSKSSLLALSLMAGVLSVGCGSSATPANAVHTTPAGLEQTSQLCAPGTTRPSDRFASVHGSITYIYGSEIWALDPRHPANRTSLGPSQGATSLAWSRDGSRLLLIEQSGSGDAIKQDLCVVNADGSQRRLTSDGGSGEGSFSPAGTKVVFTRFDDGLYVVDARGGSPQLIARSYMSWWLGSPAWSPDGSSIAYSVYLEGGPDPGVEIWSMNPDGSDPHPLVHQAGCRIASGLGWSPDGSMLAFHSTCGTGGIYVMHADGSGLRRIANAFQPSWSPDGSRLAFTGTTDFGSDGFELFTMSPDGSKVTQVKDVRVVPYGGLAWNPVRY